MNSITIGPGFSALGFSTLQSMSLCQLMHHLDCIFALHLRDALWGCFIYKFALGCLVTELLLLLQLHCFSMFPLGQLFQVEWDHSLFYFFSYQVIDLDTFGCSIFLLSVLFTEAIIRTFLTTISAPWSPGSLSSAWVSSVDLIDTSHLGFLSFDFGNFALFLNFLTTIPAPWFAHHTTYRDLLKKDFIESHLFLTFSNSI